MNELQQKIKPSDLLKQGWINIKNNIYIKTPPYPFALQWDEKTMMFKIIDAFFPEINSSTPSFLTIETISEYNKLTDETLILTNGFSIEEMKSYLIRLLFKSYKNFVKIIIDEIELWDANVKENQTNLFIIESIKQKFLLGKFDDFLKEKIQVNGENRSFGNLKARLMRPQIVISKLN